MLRQQLILLQRRSRGRVRVTNADRVFLVQLYRWFPAILQALKIIRPETLVRWHRLGFRSYWRWKSRNRAGRPQIDTDLRALICQMSLDNPLWGAPRMHGELLKLGFEVAQSTVANYMVNRRGRAEAGLRPALRLHHRAARPWIARLDQRDEQPDGGRLRKRSRGIRTRIGNPRPANASFGSVVSSGRAQWAFGTSQSRRGRLARTVLLNDFRHLVDWFDFECLGEGRNRFRAIADVPLSPTNLVCDVVAASRPSSPLSLSNSRVVVGAERVPLPLPLPVPVCASASPKAAATNAADNADMISGNHPSPPRRAVHASSF
jgi:hypothetical protein